MRILLAHNHYTVHGGAEVFFHEVARVLRENGLEVASFAPAEDDLDAPYADLFPEAADYKNGGLIKRAAQIPSMIYNRCAKTAFAKMIETFKPDVIHAFAIYVRLTPAILEAAHEAGVPVVLSCNDYKHICPNYKLYRNGKICEECKGGRFRRAAINRCCHGSLATSVVSMTEAYVHDWMDLYRKNVSMFLFASQFMADKTEEFWGKDRVKIDFLPNPFDANKYHVPANVGDYFLYFGRLIDEKGVDTLMEAARTAPDVAIVIVGEGPDRAKLEREAETLENVRVVGPAWGDELSSWLEGARAVVVPSLWHENFPYVIFQAFAASLPVIGSRRGGIPQLVNAGPHGWIYEATDATALAAQMREVLETPDEKIAYMGAEARDYVEREFSDDAIYGRLMRIYEQVLE